MKTASPITAATLIDLASPAKVLAHAIEHSDSISIERDGTYHAWYDDYANDTRLVVRYRGGYTYYDVTTIRGYDAERGMWTRETGETRIEMLNRRGQAACKALHVKMATMLGHVCPGSRTVHLYRNAEGGWK